MKLDPGIPTFPDPPIFQRHRIEDMLDDLLQPFPDPPEPNAYATSTLVTEPRLLRAYHLTEDAFPPAPAATGIDWGDVWAFVKLQVFSVRFLALLGVALGVFVASLRGAGLSSEFAIEVIAFLAALEAAIEAVLQAMGKGAMHAALAARGKLSIS